MNGHRWGFEEAEDWEYEEPQETAAPSGEDFDAPVIAGQDPDAIVTVNVSPAAEVLSVELATGWKRDVDPRGLHANVVAAANTATMQALAWQVEEVQQNPPTPPFGNAQNAPADESPLGTEDILRLADAVSVELERFTQQAATVIDHQISAESAGGHVQGSARNGQVLDVSLDSGWASGVRNSEIEHEITDVLRELHRRSTPGDLVTGPEGSAIAEIMGLLYDPQRLARRVGLIPPVPSGDHNEGK